MEQQQPNWQDIFRGMRTPRPPRASKPARQVRHGELKAALIALLFALGLFYVSLPPSTCMPRSFTPTSAWCFLSTRW